MRKDRISSGVRELKSLSPNWAVSLERIDWWVLMMFFLNEACDAPANNGYLEGLSWCTSLDEFSLMLPYDYHIYNKFLGGSAFCSGKISSLLKLDPFSPTAFAPS